MKTKVYNKKSEKVIDFLLGFLLIPSFVGITMNFVLVLTGFRSSGSVVASLAVFLLEIIAAIYLCRKRKFMGIGLLFALVVVPLVILGTCLFIFVVPSFFGPLFRR